jgi:hypothetical protein
VLQDVSIIDVNEVVKKVGNIFKHTSASVFGSKCKKSFCEKNKAENKPWFDMNIFLTVIPINWLRNISVFC